MNARILVVEDEEALTTLLRYNLDAEGYDVETVGRGDDAVATPAEAERVPGSRRARLDVAGPVGDWSSAAGCGRGRKPGSFRSSC